MTQAENKEGTGAAVALGAGGQQVLETVRKLGDGERQALIIETLKGETVIWLADLVKKLQDVFGVSAAALAPAAAAATAAAPQEKPEEKTEFKVVLKAVGEQKIQVVKVVRQITNLPLREAKELVDKAPSTLKEAANKEEAEKIKKELAAAGATVELV